MFNTPIRFENMIRVLSAIFIAQLFVSKNALQVNCQSQLNEINSSPDLGDLPRLIFTEENRINAIGPNGENFIELATSAEPLSPVFDCDRKLLYWIDGVSKIQSFDYYESKYSSVIPDDEISVYRGLALDFVKDKLYIANDAFHTIEVVDLKTGIRGVIRSEKLSTLKDIAVDPYEEYLFILTEKELVRTDLDGLNLHYILEGPPSALRETGYPKVSLNINSIVLDRTKKRLYWVNDIARTISSSNYNGTNQKVFMKYGVADGNEIRSPMAFISNTPFWIDNNKGVIRRINSSALGNPNNSKIIHKGIAEKMSWIASMDCDSNHQHHHRQQQGTNPCENENGGCQHLCILSRSSKSNYRCFCKVGYELAKDGKTCNPPTKFITFTEDESLRGINWREDINQFIDVLDPLLHGQGQQTELDLDIEKGLIFYKSTSIHHKLHGINLNDRKKFTLSPDFLSKEVSEIAYDWASKNLYYFTRYYSDESTLNVMHMKNTSYSKILAKGCCFQSGLVVHPNRGYVYFVEAPVSWWGQTNPSKVMRIHADGSNSTLMFEGRKTISCMAIDYQEDKLYWHEVEEHDAFLFYNTMYHSDLDGKQITKVEIPLYKPTMMDIQGDWIYAINNDHQSLDRVPKKGGEPERIITARVFGLKIFDPLTQTIRSDHPCAGSENTCDKFCFAVPKTNTAGSLQRICGCPYGEKLAENGRSCIDNSKEEPPLVSCPSDYPRCMNPQGKYSEFYGSDGPHEGNKEEWVNINQ